MHELINLVIQEESVCIGPAKSLGVFHALEIQILFIKKLKVFGEGLSCLFTELALDQVISLAPSPVFHHFTHLQGSGILQPFKITVFSGNLLSLVHTLVQDSF